MRLSARSLAQLREHNVFLSDTGGDRLREGDRLDCLPQAEIEPYAEIFTGQVLPRAMGAFSYSYSRLWAEARIGRYCSIAGGVAVMGDPHPMDRVSTAPFSYLTRLHPGYVAAWRDRGAAFRPDPFTRTPPAVTIGHDVWIGEGVLLARGIAVGTGAVIGARAVVTKDVEPYAIVAGIPARVIRHRFAPAIRAALLASGWWRFHMADIAALGTGDVGQFPARLAEAVAAGRMSPYEPAPLIGQRLLETEAQ